MILYSLNCSCGHSFEDWFDNSADFDRKRDTGILTCPTCHGHDVHKAIMAPRIGAAAKSGSTATLPPCLGGSGPEGGPACGGCCGGGPHNH